MFGIFGKKRKETPQPETPQPVKSEPEKITDISFSDLLISHGLKVTAARIAVLEALRAANKPVDSQFLIEELQNALGVDRVTIFRILNTLSEKDIIRKLEFREGKSRYELNLGDHHHIICEKCGKIEDVLDCTVGVMQEKIKGEKGFLIKRHSLEFFGLCHDCQNM